jgi:hypothetical protein
MIGLLHQETTKDKFAWLILLALFYAFPPMSSISRLLLICLFPFVISVENLAISIYSKIFRKRKEKKRVNEHFMVGNGSIVNLFHSFRNKQTNIRNMQFASTKKKTIYFI